MIRIFPLLLILGLGAAAPASEPPRYDVVIAGGSTAALAAAYAAADEGATVALLEPTDWIGGQLTASAVPAIDEAWHKLRAPDGRVLLDVAAVDMAKRAQRPATPARTTSGSASRSPRTRRWNGPFPTGFGEPGKVAGQLRDYDPSERQPGPVSAWIPEPTFGPQRPCSL